MTTTPHGSTGKRRSSCFSNSAYRVATARRSGSEARRQLLGGRRSRVAAGEPFQPEPDLRPVAMRLADPHQQAGKAFQLPTPGDVSGVHGVETEPQGDLADLLLGRQVVTRH